MNKKYAILFVCTGNTCRSPMAEGALRMLLEKERPGRAEVRSAGIAAASGCPATLYAQEAVKTWNLDISAHESRPLTAHMIEQADLVLAMSPEHLARIVRIAPEAASKAYLFKNFPDPNPTGEGVEDPIGQTLDRYNAVFLEIAEYLGKYLPELVKRIDEHGDGD